jgi:hypothetical protein
LDRFHESGVAQATRSPAATTRADHEQGFWKSPGLGPLTPVETDWGNFPAQTLRARDRVRTRSGGYREILRVDRFLLDEAFLDEVEDAQPVLVQQGRIGYGMPKEPVLLAPGQLLSPGQGLPPSIETARDLLRIGIGLRRPESFLTYVVLHFDEPVDICAAGLWLRVEPHVAEDSDDD